MESYPEYGASVYDESNRPVQYEIGGEGDVVTPWDAFMSEPVRVGANTEIGANIEIGGNTEIGDDDELGGNVEIGAAAALRKVVQTARDNRHPAPPMRAVEVDAPDPRMDAEWALTDTFLGAAEATGNPDPYPLTTRLLKKYGGDHTPRIVRVDTEESYQDLRAAGSPEMAEFRARLEDLQYKLDAHAHDPYAHQRLEGEISDLSVIGAAAQRAMEETQIDMGLGPAFIGQHDAWVDGDTIYASVKLAGSDGKPCWCTAAESRDKAIAEMSQHAADANVPPSLVVGTIPPAGERIGAANVMKELVAAAPSLLKQAETRRGAPFVVRILPAQSPALCALWELARECGRGNAQACEEWKRLAETGAPVVKQAMAQTQTAARG